MPLMDPRTAVVEKRLLRVRRIAGFCSAKGGVGKTMCTAVAAAALAGTGRRVGVLDLDLQGASTHLFLGVTPHLPQEKEGILPLPVVGNLSLMSVTAFTGERAMALRGAEVSDAIRELLAVTQWGDLDYLLVDMPPGIGEEVLDLARLIPRMESIVISTPSRVSIAVVERLLAVLSEMGVRVPGVIANMVRGDAEGVREMSRRCGVPFGGEVPWEPEIERAAGDSARLAATGAAAALLRALAAMGYL
jgi:ATP-binding protein involved in chromosome partitioning